MIEPCKLDERDYCQSGCKRYHAGHTRKWALGDDPLSRKKREAWRALANGEKPAILQQARSYISTLSQHVLNNFAEVPTEVREQRQAICNGCDKRDPVKNACKVCGCKLEKTFLGDKLAWAVSSCPLGKWQAYHENPPANGGISGVENPNVSFENSMTESNKLLLNAIRFDHENLHPQVIPGLRFNSTIIEQA